MVIAARPATPQRDVGFRFDRYAANDGCEVAPHCEDCPLSECRYEGKGLRVLKAKDRNVLIRALSKSGLSVAAIALQESISERQVFRILAS